MKQLQTGKCERNGRFALIHYSVLPLVAIPSWEENFCFCYAADFARIKEHSVNAWPLRLCSLLGFTLCGHSCLDWKILLVLRCRFSLVTRSTVWTTGHRAFIHCSIELSFTLCGYSSLDWKSLLVLRCRFSLIIRSTDNGSPPMRLDKTFTISVTDANEKPTAIQVSRVWLVIYNNNWPVSKIMKFPLIGSAGQVNKVITQTIKCRYEVYCSVLSFLLFLPMCSSAGRKFIYEL